MESFSLCSKIDEIISTLNELTQKSDVNQERVRELIKQFISHSIQYPELGKNLFESTLCLTQHEDEHKKNVLMACSLICMCPDAMNKVCEHLNTLKELCETQFREDYGKHFEKIKTVLRDNSLEKLLNALDVVDDKIHEALYDDYTKIIIVFLRHYPDAYVAHYPECRESLLFSLKNTLQKTLDRNIFPDVIVINGEEIRFTMHDIAEMLCKNL
jgi:hypothetical protein